MSMEIEYIEYVTSDGDRWDLIAYAMYGTVAEMETIIRANNDVALLPVLPAGITLRIPVLNADSIAASEELPPWKQ